jgi:hypothetical protein
LIVCDAKLSNNTISPFNFLLKLKGVSSVNSVNQNPSFRLFLKW